MPVEDAVRWNKRYTEAPDDWFQSPRSFLLQHMELLPRTGRALDLAMGAGQNAALLAQRGLQVVGIDISTTGVLQAKMREPHIQAVIADLCHFRLPVNTFDVVLNFYYLQRSLFPNLKHILKPGGLLFFESLTRDMLISNPEIDPEYLLHKNELKEAFSDWDILLYQEGWIQSDHGHQKAVASMIARNR